MSPPGGQPAAGARRNDVGEIDSSPALVTELAARLRARGLSPNKASRDARRCVANLDDRDLHGRTSYVDPTGQTAVRNVYAERGR